MTYKKMPKLLKRPIELSDSISDEKSSGPSGLPVPIVTATIGILIGLFVFPGRFSGGQGFVLGFFIGVAILAVSSWRERRLTGRLTKTTRITCPECGHAFYPCPQCGHLCEPVEDIPSRRLTHEEREGDV